MRVELLPILITSNGTTTMTERKLISIKEREFEFNIDSYTGKSRYIHKLGVDEDLYNVKRQFDEILQRYGITSKENVRALPGRIIFTEAAYKAWQDYKSLEPVRKPRTPPELRMFEAHDHDTYVLKLNDETARVVAGTLSANAKEIHNVSDVNITYNKDKNEIYIDKYGLANYLRAIQQNKPYLLQNYPHFHQYINTTLCAIENAEATKKNGSFSNALALSSLGFRAKQNRSTLRNKTLRQEDTMQSNQPNKKKAYASAA